MIYKKKEYEFNMVCIFCVNGHENFFLPKVAANLDKSTKCANCGQSLNFVEDEVENDDYAIYRPYIKKME